MISQGKCCIEGCKNKPIHYRDFTLTGIGDIREYCSEHEDEMREREKMFNEYCHPSEKIEEPKFTQADMDKAIEQAKRETAEKCAERFLEVLHLSSHRAMYEAIRAVGGGDE